jgi:esterase/lipase
MLRIASYVLLGMLLTGCSTSRAPRQDPSGHRILASDLDQPFAGYVERSREKILAASVKGAKPAGRGAGPWQQGAERRFPFELPLKSEASCDAAGRAEAKGFLLLHGYTDSPHLMRAIGDKLRGRYPCAPIRAIALPGHATVPGDLLETDHQEWIEAARLAIEGMPAGVRELWVVGFSTGGLLAADYALDHPEDSRVAGLVLLSPLVAVQGAPEWLGLPMDLYSTVKPWSTGGPWPPVNTEPYEDLDPVKYESVPVHANAQIVRLTGRFRPKWEGRAEPLRVPVFAAVSADDQTVVPDRSLAFFCAVAPPDRRRLVWYVGKGEETRRPPVDRGCASTLEVRPAPASGEALRFSHVSLPAPPEDPVYGKDGTYRNCLHYWFVEGLNWRAARAKYAGCKEAPREKVAFGETDDSPPRGKDYVARLTYNPDFEGLVASVLRFIDADGRVGPAPGS